MREVRGTAVLSEAPAPTFPPLLRGQAVPAGTDPLAAAARVAAAGTDPGLILWADNPARMEAALVLAPEVPLDRALTVAYAIALGLGDALGALAPPEVAIQYDWPGGFVVNGGICGAMRAASSSPDPLTEPDWLVIGVRIDFVPPDGYEPGSRPDRTFLHLEGCGDLMPTALLESWSRHSLVWINTWSEGGLPALYESWRGRARGLGDAGFLGLDDLGNRLRRTPGGTALDPLSSLLMPA